MKRLFLALFACMVLASAVFCAQEGNSGNAPGASAGQQDNGNGLQPTLYGQVNGSEEAGQERSEAQSGQETGRGNTVQQEQQARNEGDGTEPGMMRQAGGENRSQAMMLNQSIEEARENYGREAMGMPARQMQVYQNQNAMRVAVHALLGAENITGIGKNVSAIAREFNNSVQATVRSEERIRERGGMERFLFGGDEKAAGELEQQATQNQEMVMQMQLLVLQCSGCGAEVQSMLQEQLQNMEQEQSRLMQLAHEEKRDRGIFGWLWK